MNQRQGNSASLRGFGEGKFKIVRLQFTAEEEKRWFSSNINRKLVPDLWRSGSKGTTAGYGSSAWCLQKITIRRSQSTSWNIV